MPPTPVPAGPQALTPARIAATRRAWPCRARRGRVLQVPLIGADHPPVVDELPALAASITHTGRLDGSVTVEQLAASITSVGRLAGSVQ